MDIFNTNTSSFVDFLQVFQNPDKSKTSLYIMQKHRKVRDVLLQLGASLIEVDSLSRSTLPKDHPSNDPLTAAADLRERISKASDNADFIFTFSKPDFTVVLIPTIYDHLGAWNFTSGNQSFEYAIKLLNPAKTVPYQEGPIMYHVFMIDDQAGLIGRPSEPVTFNQAIHRVKDHLYVPEPD